MTDLIVLGFESRELAEEARRRSATLAEQDLLDLQGAALAYRRDDGHIELVQPLHLAAEGAATGALSGALIGLALLAPVLTAAVGAVGGVIGAEVSAAILNARFVHELTEVLEPGRAALFLVARDSTDPAIAAKTVEALRPLSPRVLRTNWSAEDERRLILALAEQAKPDIAG